MLGTLKNSERQGGNLEIAVGFRRSGG